MNLHIFSSNIFSNTPSYLLALGNVVATSSDFGNLQHPILTSSSLAYVFAVIPFPVYWSAGGQGMIERAVGCLEKRGFRLSYPAHGVPLRSYRRLHSAFWSHGAGSINLPSWWIALLQLPQAKEASGAGQEDIKPRFLDFLYPSQALAFIQKNISTGSAVVTRHRQIVTAHQRSRAYTSPPADTLLDPSDPAASFGAKSSAHQLVDEEISTDRTRAENLKTRLDNLLLVDDVKADLSELWMVYLEMQSSTLTLHPRQVLRLLRCLAKSASKVNRERSLQVFGSLPITERKSIHYSYAISAALNNEKIEAAVRFHSEALLGIHVSIGTSSLLSYTVERRFWQVAVEIWLAHWNHKERNVESSDIWVNVDTISLPELWDCTLSAIDFAAGLTELADSGIAAAVRRFALQLSLRSFALRKTKEDSIHDATTTDSLKQTHFAPDSIIRAEHRMAYKQQQLFDKATSLQAPTYELYESAIRQALSFQTKLYVTQALRFYQALRANTHITPTPDLLEALLRQFCGIRSQAGILLMVDDYRSYHRTLPKKIFYLAVKGLAAQGHHRSIEVLLEEYCFQYGKITSPFLANSILIAYRNRGEVKSVVETFKALEDRYGFKPSVESFGIVIATYARVGDVEGASTWYNNLLDSGFKPARSTFVFLMIMFAQRGDLDMVKQLLRQSETYGIETNIDMINTLVLAHLKNGQLADAETLVNEALEVSENVPQESRTRMWNYLLNAFAMRGDPKKVADLHRKMRANKIPSNGVTLAALLQALCIITRPRLAYKILKNVMPQLGMQANSLHYAICMSGYLLIKRYYKPFVLYSEMLRKGIKPDLAVHNSLIRAAAGIDTEKGLEVPTEGEQQTYENARRIFEQAMQDLDPADLATTNPIKIIGIDRLDESFTSSYFSYLIFLYGKEKATDQVKILYDQYSKIKVDFNMDVESIPPIQMLSALMAADLQTGNHDGVDRYWELSLEKAQKLACREGTKHSEPGWVLPARRFILNVHLRHYMRSLIDRSKYDEIDKVIEHLHYCGYELDSKSWNFYVRVLLRNYRVLLAFQLCEKELMPGWAGWEPRLKRQLSLFMQKVHFRHSLEVRRPTHLELHRRLPEYQTIVHLANKFAESESSVGAEGEIPTTQQLYEVAPESVGALLRLPR